MRFTTVLCVSVLALAACGEQRAAPSVAPAPSPAPAPASTSAPPNAAAPTDAWLGQWTGPEGTSLKLAGGQGAYDVTVTNLDGPRTFKGQADGDTVRFERDGKPEVLRATDGAGTGMKWLADKTDCLVVAPGEGFCRK